MRNLNYTPNRILNELGLNQDNTCLPPYPFHVRVRQDSNMGHYQQCFLKLKFNYYDNYLNPNKSELASWQIKEAFRILNAAIASKNSSVKAYLSRLIALRNELEKEPEITQQISKIQKGLVTPDIICSGHGGWTHMDGFVDLNFTNAEVAFYCAPGAGISENLGVNIENDMLRKDQIIIYTPSNYGQPLPLASNIAYPAVLSKYNARFIPNYRLAADNRMNARLLEDGTGFSLVETNQSIHLSDVIRMYPNNRIHWAACRSMYNPFYYSNLNQNSVWDMRHANKNNTLYYKKSNPHLIFNHPPSQKTKHYYSPYQKDYDHHHAHKKFGH